MIKQVSLLLGCLAIGCFSYAEKDSECKSNGHELISENAVTPRGLIEYINSNRLSSVDDVICCLPKVYRQNFAIAHSSDSAQTSDVARPRVLLFGPKIDQSGQTISGPLRSVLSFNSGAKEFNKSDNIEMLYNDMSRGEVELYDFDFQTSNRVTISGPNTKECLLCHGNQGSAAAGGAKPIFEPSDLWTRFVEGVHVCSDEKPLAEKIQSVVQTTFQASAQKQSRYRCLDQKVATDDHFTKHDTFVAPELTDLDNLLTQVNDRRNAKWIHQTPNYKEFKYAAIGMVFCMDVRNDITDLPNPKSATLKYWIPEKVLNAMTDVSSISGEFKSSAKPIAAFRKMLDESSKFRSEIGAQQALVIKKLDAGIATRADFYRGPLGCFEDSDFLTRQISATLTGDSVLDLYKIDSAYRSIRGRTFNPFFRYLFESRGISLANVSEEAVPGVYLPLSRSLAQALIELEPKGTVLFKLATRLRKVGAAFPLFPTNDDLEEMKKTGPVTESERAKTVAKVCSELKQISYSSLSLLRVADLKLPKTPARVPARAGTH